MKSKLCMIVCFIIIGSNLNVSYMETKRVENEKIVLNEPQIIEDPIVYDGLTKKELIEKINRSLNDDLKDKAELYVNYSLEKNVDPYLAVAISLHETGCKWKCSTLVKKCNNVGGMVGSNKCGNTSYNSFDTLDIGIKKFIDNLADNYISQGLTTPELMNKKYATSKTWAIKVNKYINEIKES